MDTGRHPRRILFVCIQNSCRSQMAEGFARAHGGSGLEAFSAGSRPSGEVDATAIRLMRERGHDLSPHRSKSLDEIPAGSYDAVVSMGCGDACPWVPAQRRLEWDIPDPKGMPDRDFREVRDRIEAKVRDLLMEMGAADPPGSA